MFLGALGLGPSEWAKREISALCESIEKAYEIIDVYQQGKGKRDRITFARKGPFLLVLRDGPCGGFREHGVSAGRMEKRAVQHKYYENDYLCYVRVVTDADEEVLEHNDYSGFGQRLESSTGSANRYRYNGKEEQVTGSLGLIDYGARLYDNLLPRWTTPDPLAEKYYSYSPYAFCNNNPVNFVDPDGRDGIYINFPDYVISVGNMQFENLGHSGILLINNQTGLTKYYEYGRYDKQNIGIVRNIKVPNVVIGEDGRPEKESLDKVFGAISQIAGDGGKIEGAYVESNEFEAMNDYAQSLMTENENPEREPYNIMNNNCSTFAEDVLKQDRNIEKKAPISLFNIPNSVVKKWQNEFIPISFNNKIE